MHLRMLTRGALASYTSLALVACGASKTNDQQPSVGLDSGNLPETNPVVDGDLGETDPPTPVFQNIALEPAHATIYVDTATTPATPATLSYKATLNLADGTSRDVSLTVTLAVDDPALGTFAGPDFTSASALPTAAVGVTTVVHAEAEGARGDTTLTIVQLRKTGPKRDFFFVEPYGGAPIPDRDVLEFGTNIKQVDVAISEDTTGSMGGSLTNLKTNITTTLLPSLVKAIPSVGMAIAYHDDYPVGGYGSSGCGGSLPGDLPVGVIQVVTTSLTIAQAAANKLELHCGSDGPEAQVSSMWHLLNGKQLQWTGGSVPLHKPKPGTFGGVDFRPGSLPVVVEITDVSWHDVAKDPYGSDVISPPSVADLKKEFVRTNARFVDITNGAYSAPEDQANDLSDGSKSHIPKAAFGKCPTAGAGPCCTGIDGEGRAATGPGGSCRLNFLHNSGAGVSASIVKAIQAISVGSQFDVTAVPSNDPTNADGVDATQFIQALRAMEEGDGADCLPHGANDTDGDGVKDTFLSVVVGTPVCFEVIPKINTTVKPKAEAQFFNAFIDVLGMPGSVKLDSRLVGFEVPPGSGIPK